MDLFNRFQSITLAVSVFLLFGLLDGIRMSFGVLLLDWTSNFGAGRAEVGWVGAIVYGVSNLSGSLSSFVIRRTSCHVTIAVGSGMVAAGLFLSSFAVNITYLYFSYGILIGLGYCMAYLSGLVLLSRHFRRRLSLAMGFTACGGGLGVFIVNPTVRILTDHYSWRGALWILSAILLHGVVIACVTKVTTSRKHTCRKDTRLKNNKPLLDEQSGDNNMCKTYNADDSAYLTDYGNPHIEKCPCAMKHNKIPLNTLKEWLVVCDDSVVSLSKAYKDQKITLSCPCVFMEETTRADMVNLNGKMCRKLLVCRGDCDACKCYRKKYAYQRFEKYGLNEKHQLNSEEFPKGQYETEIMVKDFDIIHVPERNQIQCCAGALHVDTHKDKAVRQLVTFACFLRGVRYIFATVAQIIWPSHVLKNRRVVIFLLSSFIRSFPFFIPVTYLPDLVVSTGYSPLQASWVASISGITTTVCLAVVGWMADLRCVNRIVLFSICTTFSGLVTCFSYLYTNLALLIGYTIMFSFFFSGHSVLTPVVLTDISSAEEFPDTIGYLWTTTGIGTMIGTPIAGLLFDVNRNYDVAFAVSGGVIAVSGLVAASLLCIKGRAQNRDLQVNTPDKQ